MRLATAVGALNILVAVTLARLFGWRPVLWFYGIIALLGTILVVRLWWWMRTWAQHAWRQPDDDGGGLRARLPRARGKLRHGQRSIRRPWTR